MKQEFSSAWIVRVNVDLMKVYVIQTKNEIVMNVDGNVKR